MKLRALTLLILHHHLRPGGVRRVIELATPHLVAHWPERVRAVLLATGEAPDPAWLRAFRERLHGTRVKVIVEPAFGYVSELALDARSIRRRVVDGIMELLPQAMRDDCLVWAHNLGLGRNLYLARELTFTCRCVGLPLIAHHHDWWFENRWHHFAAMREPGFRTLRAVASAVLAASPRICHVAINHADAAVLEKHFPGLAGWLPNPVEPVPQMPAARLEAARAWLRELLGEDAPVWLLPCRLLRRKNIAEALLLTRWLRPEAWLVTTGGVSSAEEQAYADALAAAAQMHGWRLRLGILNGRRKLEAVRAGTAPPPAKPSCSPRFRKASACRSWKRPPPGVRSWHESCPTSRLIWRSSDSPSPSATGNSGWIRRCLIGGANANARPDCLRNGRA